MDDLEETIRQAAKDPAQVSVDGFSAQSQPIPDLIEADRHLAAKSAAAKNHLGMTLRKLEPGGCG